MPNVRRSISMEEDVDKALTRYMGSDWGRSFPSR